ncbi:MAG: hypothetical protein KGL93_03710 [Gemmatimonadota bacterium]|nr:hypothetical protein [Gemmatimonadota bacterium]HEU4989535.1 hypothetical protein [Gemmatimonadaceae bacterium]
MGLRRPLVILGAVGILAACRNSPVQVVAPGYTLVGTWQAGSPDPAKFFASDTGTLLIVPCLRIQSGPVELDDSLRFATVGSVVYAGGFETFNQGDTVSITGRAGSRSVTVSARSTPTYTLYATSSPLPATAVTCNQ